MALSAGGLYREIPIPGPRLRAMMSELRENASVESAVDRPDVPGGTGEREGPTQEDEHAEMRKTVARQYADALGKPYEPPDDDDSGESGDQTSFDNVEIDTSKIAEYAMNPEHPKGQHKFRVINSATGLTRTDADQIEAQIRDGVRNGKPVAGKCDEYGHRWSVDVPITGPAGTMTVRTAWIVEPGSTTPRLATVTFPPKDK
jgi:hypothetical protein